MQTPFFSGGGRAGVWVREYLQNCLINNVITDSVAVNSCLKRKKLFGHFNTFFLVSKLVDSHSLRASVSFLETRSSYCK